jgi:ABC-type sugar transport system permease subunit
MRLRLPGALLFLSPALLLYAAFVLYPFVRGFAYSLTDFTGAGEANFVGLSNYLRITTDSRAQAAFGVTLLYTVVVVVAQNAVGLGLAVWMGNFARLRNLARVVFFIPSMLSGVVVAFLWSFMYSPLGGVVNSVLALVGLGSLQRVWLGDPGLALLAVAFVNVWMFAGQSAAIYLANYLSLPGELRDASKIDGATPWQRFWYVEWPLLAPATTISVTITLIGSLRVFDLPFLLTRGGPGDATEVLGIAIYRAAFSQQEFGYATALAVALTVLVVVVSAVQALYLRRREANL